MEKYTSRDKDDPLIHTGSASSTSPAGHLGLDMVSCCEDVSEHLIPVCGQKYVGATVVFVDYHRAPEHHYPVAIEDAYAATLYVSERNERFQVDSKRLAVAGESSGGNMALLYVCSLSNVLVPP